MIQEHLQSQCPSSNKLSQDKPKQLIISTISLKM